MPHFTPPTKVDVHQRGMMGFSFRQLTIVGISLAAALGLLVVLSGAPAFQATAARVCMRWVLLRLCPSHSGAVMAALWVANSSHR